MGFFSVPFRNEKFITRFAASSNNDVDIARDY